MINLDKLPTTAPKDLDKDEARKVTRYRAKRIAQLHAQLVAEGKHSVLIVLQGMDSSGKDGAVRNVFGECSPMGLRSASWKKPTELEFRHDFLWRIHKEVPAKGEMVLFNRSHYEEVLIQRVHGWVDEAQVDQRFKSINAFGTTMETGQSASTGRRTGRPTTMSLTAVRFPGTSSRLTNVGTEIT